jgi:Flp pilus assembly pilin Flp
MMRAMLALLRDDTGNALVEYAIVAAGIALPLIGIGYAIAQSAGSGLGQTTSSLSKLGTNPP